MEAFEKIVRCDEEGNITLKLGKNFAKKEARVVVRIKEDEINENEWLGVAMNSGCYDFLSDPSEDIYSMEEK